MINHYTITIPCKYYIKVYLENNCGIPVDLSCFPQLFDIFRTMLTKIGEPIKKLSTIGEIETVTLIIPNDWFYRYGYLMSKPSILKFNLLVEKQLKFKMRQYIGMNSACGRTVASCIRDFQDEYCLPESVLAFESIKKDYDRHGNKINQKYNKRQKSLKQNINNLISKNLLDLGMNLQKY